MTRGRDEKIALVVTDTPDVAAAISILEAAIVIDRADIPAITHRRTLAAAMPTLSQRPRVEIPDWSDQVRAEAEKKRRLVQKAVDDRNAERAARQDRVAAARRDLPAAKVAHAPFEEMVIAAKRVVNEARSDLRSAEYELRKSGCVHRRSARRTVEAATDVVAVAVDRLTRTVDLAAPTGAPLDDLSKIIDDDRQFESTHRILDEWNDLDGVANRANDLCGAVARWQDWAMVSPSRAGGHSDQFRRRPLTSRPDRRDPAVLDQPMSEVRY